MYEDGEKNMKFESYFHHHSQEIINSVLPIKKQLESLLEKFKAPTPKKDRNEKGKKPRIGFTAPDFTTPIISKVQELGWYAEVDFIEGIFVPHGNAALAIDVAKFDEDYNFSRAIRKGGKVLSKCLSKFNITEGELIRKFPECAVALQSSSPFELKNIQKNELDILLEVEFGNSASAFRDLWKFLMAHSLEMLDIGILIVPKSSLAHKMSSGIITYERLLFELGLAKHTYPVPVWLIGVEMD